MYECTAKATVPDDEQLAPQVFEAATSLADLVTEHALVAPSEPPLEPIASTPNRPPSRLKKRLLATLGAAAMLLPLGGSTTETHAAPAGPCDDGNYSAQAGEVSSRQSIYTRLCIAIAARTTPGQASRSASRTPKAPVAPPTAHPGNVTVGPKVETKITITPEQERIIESANLGSQQKAFLRKAVIAAEQLVRSGRAKNVNLEVMIAQAALESNWGESAPYNNYFGMKYWGEPGTKPMPHKIATTEYANGRAFRTTALFQAFDSMADSFAAYVRMLQGKRYFRDSLGHVGNPGAALDNLLDDGMAYATDPNYKALVLGIIRRCRLAMLLRDVETAQLGEPQAPSHTHQQIV